VFLFSLHQLVSTIAVVTLPFLASLGYTAGAALARSKFTHEHVVISPVQ
jgi:hypothetical protein